jgi:glycolate oxidase FAD binding subunit
MTDIVPADEVELAAALEEAAADRTPLAVVGGGTRSGLGRPMQTAATLSTARLTGVTLYEPAEQVLSARAGTPLVEIEELLAKNRQRLAFEPVDHRGFYGTIAGEPTIGGVAAANLSGPRRIHSGAARDGMIGVRAVTGAGKIVKSGGRVMKNVVGYDLVKFLAGSLGTLAVLSEISFKLQPTPETEATVAITASPTPAPSPRCPPRSVRHSPSPAPPIRPPTKANRRALIFVSRVSPPPWPTAPNACATRLPISGRAISFPKAPRAACG